jgi:hypothetical protein
MRRSTCSTNQSTSSTSRTVLISTKSRSNDWSRSRGMSTGFDSGSRTTKILIRQNGHSMRDGDRCEAHSKPRKLRSRLTRSLEGRGPVSHKLPARDWIGFRWIQRPLFIRLVGSTVGQKDRAVFLDRSGLGALDYGDRVDDASDLWTCVTHIHFPLLVSDFREAQTLRLRPCPTELGDRRSGSQSHTKRLVSSRKILLAAATTSQPKFESNGSEQSLHPF